MPRPDRVLAAVLFTDIVDSTSIAEQLGDRGWRALVSRHHAVVRRALKQHGGKELDTAGDGFFASFPDPGSAVRCACSVSDQLRDLGLAMRAGVHFGECEPADGKLSGINVVVGARLMSSAAPGEVLVTSTVAELTRGAGFGLQDRGVQALKGVEQPWQVFAVTSVDEVPRLAPLSTEEALAARGNAAAEAGLASSRRRWGVMAVAAATIVIVSVVAGWLLTRSSTVVPDGDSVARLAPGGAGFDLAVPLQSGGLPQAVAADADRVWVADVRSQTVTQLSTDGTDLRVVGTPAGPTDIASVGSDAWVTYGFSSDPGRRVDIVHADGGLTPADVPVPDGTTPVSSADGVVWLSAQRSALVTRVDTVTGLTATAQLPADSGPVDIAAASDLSTAWIAAGRRDAVYRVDVRSNVSQVSAYDTGDATPTSIAVAPDGTVWIAARDDDTVIELAANGDSRLRLELGAQCDAPTDLVATARLVWVTCGGSGTVVGLDPRTGGVISQASVTGVPVSVAAEPGGRVWVLVAPRS